MSLCALIALGLVSTVETLVRRFGVDLSRWIVPTLVVLLAYGALVAWRCPGVRKFIFGLGLPCALAFSLIAVIKVLDNDYRDALQALFLSLVAVASILSLGGFRS